MELFNYMIIEWKSYWKALKNMKVNYYYHFVFCCHAIYHHIASLFISQITKHTILLTATGPVRGIDFHKTQPLFVSGGDDYKGTDRYILFLK